MSKLAPLRDSHRSLTTRVRSVGLTCLLLGLFATSPVAADQKQECIDSHAQAQKLRRSGELIAARAQLVACAQDVCPGLVRSECAQWLEEVNAAIPTVLFEALGADGQKTAEMAVHADGELLLGRLPGVAVPLDPGEHALVFIIADGRRKQQQIILSQGEKNRRLLVDFSLPVKPPDQPPQPASQDNTDGPREHTPDGPGVPVAFYPLAGVGVVGLVLLSYFGIRALDRADELESECAPHCEIEDAEQVGELALAADISLGVSLAALTAAGIVLGIGLAKDEPDRSTPAAVVPWVAPVSSGAIAGCRVRF